MEQQYYPKRVDIGIVLVIIGMQFGTALKNVLSGVDLVNIIMLLSVVLIYNWKQFSIIRIRLNRDFRFILFLQIVLLFYSILSGGYTQQLIYYALYMLILLLALSSYDEAMRLSIFDRVLFYVAGFVSIVVAYQSTDGFTTFVTTYSYSGGDTSKLWMTYGGDPITMSRAMVVSIIACLVYQAKNTTEKILKIFFVVTSILGIMAFNNRATFIGIIVIALYYFRYQMKVNAGSEQIRTIFVSLVVLSVLFIAYLQIEYLKNSIDNILVRIIPGVSTLLGNTSGTVDSSTLTRVGLRNSVLALYDPSDGILKFIIRILFGGGFNSQFLDMPILQIFTDCGIIIGIVYVIQLIVEPVRKIFDWEKKNSFQLIVCCYAIMMTLDQFYCGSPYYYFYWTPAMLLIFAKSVTGCGEKKTALEEGIE